MTQDRTTCPPATSPGSNGRSAIWDLRLFGLADPNLDRLLTVLAVAVLVASRFLLLPSGPWERDETVFAHGLFKFDLPSHYPHPPGFPLWMALGWLTLPLVPEPLRGLQLLSALASCLTLWPLAALGRRVAPPAVAASAALLVLFAPGVWLHAGRGFSSTPAAFLALWAAALAAGGLAGRRVTAFTLLVTASFLVRPNLIPSLAILWLGVALGVHPRRRLIPGAALGLTAAVVSVAGMVWAQGSWTAFAGAFVAHVRRHTGNLIHNVGTLPDYGFVKGLGGEWWTLTLLVLSVLGTAVWWRRMGARVALTWVAVLAIGITQLVQLQARTFPRYAVPFQMALAPLVAGAAGTVASPAVAAGSLLVAAATLIRDGYPLVVEQHVSRMPGWDAVVTGADLARRHDLDVVVDPGLYPYFSYRVRTLLWRGERFPGRWHLSPASPDHRSLPQRPYLFITDRPHGNLPSLTGRAIWFGQVSEDLTPLTQRRYLTAWVAFSAPVLLDGWWRRENPPGADPFVWGRAAAEILVPALPEDSWIALDLRPARGPSDLTVADDHGAFVVIPGESGRGVVSLPVPAGADGQPYRLTFRRAEGYMPGPHDIRPLAIQLFSLSALGPHVPWRLDLTRPDRRAAARTTLEGVWSPELFSWGTGVWTRPRATISLPPMAGTLSLGLAAPRPTDPNVTFHCQGRTWRANPPADGTMAFLAIPLPCDPGRPGEPVRIEVVSQPFSPGSGDPRELGVVLGPLSYLPRGAD